MSHLHDVRADLVASDWTVDGLGGRLGRAGQSALSRDDLVALRRRSLDDLSRLFLLGDAVAEGARWAPWLAVGLLERSAGEVRARREVRPHPLLDGSPGWVVADLSAPQRPGPLAPDHVAGVGAASLQLVGAVPRSAAGRALDLGTGCGVQALHLAGHCASVVATDIDPGALECARLSHALSALAPPGLRLGSFWDPVAGDDFDLIVGNPPFVVGPARTGLTYRDGPGAGDGVSAGVVRGAGAHLAPGGLAVLMASWQLVDGEGWAERVTGWLPPGVDAWVVQRSELDAAEHTALWLRDAGGEPTEAQTAGWLDWFDEEDTTGVGYGLVVLRRPPEPRPTRAILEEQAGAVRGTDVQAWAAWCDAPTLDGEDRLAVGPDVHLEGTAELGGHGWRSGPQWLTDGRRHVELDAAAVAVLGACDGTRPLGLVLELAAAAHGIEASAALPLLGSLVRTGLLRRA